MSDSKRAENKKRVEELLNRYTSLLKLVRLADESGMIHFDEEYHDRVSKMSNAESEDGEKARKEIAEKRRKEREISAELDALKKEIERCMK